MRDAGDGSQHILRRSQVSGGEEGAASAEACGGWEGAGRRRRLSIAPPHPRRILTQLLLVEPGGQ